MVNGEWGMVNKLWEAGRISNTEQGITNREVNLHFFPDSIFLGRKDSRSALDIPC
jgi:hypothetical protein